MSRYRIAYAGLTKTTGDCSGTIVRGTSPGQFQLRVAPGNAALVGVSDLVLYEDETEVLRLRDCAFSGMEWERGGEGATAVVTLADRRWRWVKGGGSVSGSYNVRRPDGSVEPATQRSLRQLLKICFDQLEEPVVDYSDVPAISPAAEVSWDCTRTKDALDGLLSAYGLDIVLRLDNSIRVVVVGSPGGILPETNVRSRQGTLANTAIPDLLRVVGGPTRWQMLWELEPVGLDSDGKWKHVDGLSYKPLGGWSRTDPEFMLGLDGSLSEVEKKRRKLAIDTVYRCYRLKQPADFDQAQTDSLPYLPDYTEIGDSIAGRPPVRNIVLGEMLFATVQNDDGTSTNLPAEVRGVFWDTEYGAENTAPDTIWDGGFQVDAANQIVRFPKPLYKFAEDNESFAFADLVLHTTFSVRKPNLAFVRFSRDRQIQVGSNRHERIFRDIELQVTVPFSWDPVMERYTRGTVSTNVDEVIEAAEYYLNSVLQEMAPTEGEIRPLSGFVAVELDSQISQVSYAWSGMVASTQVSKNTEHRTFLPYKAMRELLAAQQGAKQSGESLQGAGLGQPVSKKSKKG